MNKNIILIGFMGSGKTTLGLRLSYRLKMPVEDTDKLIEQKEGKTISDIFSENGEKYFRDRETELLQEISTRNYTRIISVGGGTPVRKENRSLLKQCGTVVYFRIKPETVYERLKNDTTRPLLACDDPLSKISELMESRAGAYEESADIIIDVDNLSNDEILRKITNGIRNMEAAKNSAEGRIEKMKILVINGPNINFLGIREKSVYGTQDYQYLLDMIDNKAKETETDITVFQSNHEGAIIDRIQESYFDGTDAIIINPGAYTHYSYAIRDALASITVTKVEIHISDITKREEFRKVSVTAPVCDRQIYGQGLDGYLQAIDFVIWKHGFSGENKDK
jgi:3-dehydroquinate dehydratase-2